MCSLREQVENGDFDAKTVFTGDKDKFSELKTQFEQIRDDLSKNACITFVLNKLIPVIFSKDITNVTRDEALEIAMFLIESASLTALTAYEQESILAAIEDKCTKMIGELRDSSYKNWDKLWIFLVKLCAEKIHTKSNLTNKLLRVVEVAFRNSNSIEQRLKAYDCWTELIRNSSLNMDHFCRPKQLKLLMTPVKAKFSRMPLLLRKRCDTFVYLLEKLQDKATLCLEDFLKFSFGPFDDGLKQGKGVPEFCTQTTKVLLEILGHSHTEQCLDAETSLYKPLITHENFPNFCEVLIRSVFECCVLLHEWSKDLALNTTIIKCLWGSLLKFINNGSDNVKSKAYQHIEISLRKLQVNDSEQICLFLDIVIGLLLDCELSEGLKEAIFHASIKVLPNSDGSLKSQRFISECLDSENSSKFHSAALELFKNKCEHPLMCEVWLKCNPVIDIENISILIWPIRHLKSFPDREALYMKWVKLYSNECKKDIKIMVLQEMEKLFLGNPLLCSNVVDFLELISSNEGNLSGELVCKFLHLIESVLTLPTSSKENIQKLRLIVLNYCDENYSDNDEAVHKLCTCLEHLLTIHKELDILPSLLTRLSNQKNIAKFSKSLMPCLESLMLNEDNSVANNTRKLIELLEMKDKDSKSVSRSLKLVNMANGTSKLKSNLRNLFGKEKSPISKRKELPTSPRKKKEKKQIFALNDDKTEDYVKIDTEIKLDVKKLNEHQKEVLKTRKDIPALYNELTQSQSQDLFTNTESNEKLSPKDTQNKCKLDGMETETMRDNELVQIFNKRLSDDLSSALEERSKEENEKKCRRSSRKQKLVTRLITEELVIEKIAQKSEIVDDNDKQAENGEVHKSKKQKVENDDQQEKKEEIASTDTEQSPVENKLLSIATHDQSSLFEFKGRESPSLAKVKKRKSISLGFQKSDYTKRRRKPKKPKVADQAETPTSEALSIIITRSPLIESALKDLPQSEDIIESTQNSPKQKTIKSPLKQTTLDALISPKTRKMRKNKALDLSGKSTISRRLSLDTERLPKEKIQRTQSLENLEDLSTLTIPKLELTVEKAEDEKKSDDLPETLTIQEVVSPDAKATKTNDLPTSPISFDTPDRTSELLNNTSDISPINQESLTPVHKQNEVSNVRVARLLQMVNSNVQVSNEGRTWFGHKAHSSPSTKIRKMRMKKRENLDILTFSREVPSPLVVPASGILKRKFTSDDTSAPSPKRKRVNFSDPATTDKKIFLKDVEEYCDSTNERIIDLEDEEVTKALNQEDILSGFKALDSSEDINVADGLKQFLQKLETPEVVRVFADYLHELDFTDASSDELVRSFIDKINVDNVPRLVAVLETLPDEKFEYFSNEMKKVLRKKEVEDSTQTEEVDKDRVIELNRKYLCGLEGEERERFVADLMGLVSEKVPLKECVNLHINCLQNLAKTIPE